MGLRRLFARTDPYAGGARVPTGHGEGKRELLASVPLFASLDGSQLDRLDRLSEDIDVVEGRVLCREGTNPHEFFVIGTGEAEVTKNGEHVRRLGPGDFFGAIALVEGTARRTTVTALTPLRVFVLSGPSFNQLVHDNHEVERIVLRELVVENVLEREIAEDGLRRQAELNAFQALHDPLTNLPNRTLFNDRIQQSILTAERNHGRLAVLMLDLDRFKEVNDTLGHPAGDVLLQELAERLRETLRAVDTVARLGGDEFGIVLPDADRDAVADVVARLTSAIERPIVVRGLPVSVEASIGVAFSPEHGRTVEALVKHADVAMYLAKQENLGCAIYETSIGGYDEARLTLIGELREAIANCELTLVYQPKARLRGGAVTSVEALVRWNHPERGLVLPDEFIPLAQQTGLIRPLTLFVLEQAIGQCAAWHRRGVEVSVAVNISARNLVDAGFPGDIAAMLDAHGVAARWLELEITESAVLSDRFGSKRVLEQLHAAGIRLSIDDFGAGYTSLSYLRSLPISELKIDRSFIQTMLENENDAVIVRSTIELGRDLGLEVVAEGVESEAIMSGLRQLGCDVAQGYHLSKPIPPDELEAWLRERADTGESAVA